MSKSSLIGHRALSYLNPRVEVIFGKVREVKKDLLMELLIFPELFLVKLALLAHQSLDNSLWFIISRVIILISYQVFIRNSSLILHPFLLIQ
jgi:hypothetical protein